MNNGELTISDSKNLLISNLHLFLRWLNTKITMEQKFPIIKLKH
jgi:hypothetical protein